MCSGESADILGCESSGDRSSVWKKMPLSTWPLQQLGIRVISKVSVKVVRDLSSAAQPESQKEMTAVVQASYSAVAFGSA
jgi:hypothetical protein